MFTGISEQLCARAWETIIPAIEKAAKDGTINGFVGSLVILNPADPDGEPLFTGTVGDRQGHFLEYATAKARLSSRTGYDTTRVRQDVPHLFRAGDIKWPGGVYREGLAVGFSGVQGEYDEMISEWFISTLRAMCRVEFFGPEGEGAQPTPYLQP